MTVAALHPMDEQDERLALLDPVTRLPGRALFLDRCEIALARARRGHASVGVVVVTAGALDHCEESARNQLRRQVAVAVVSVMRGDDTVARFGDRFVVVCSDIRSDSDLATITARISNVLRHQAGRATATLVEASVTPSELLHLVDAS
jgi:GGDEF domain-containing protein